MATNTVSSPPVPPRSDPVLVGSATALAWARSAVAAASLGAAAVHAASIPVHFDHGTRYGIAFVVMAVAGVIATVLPILRRWRLGLWFALVANAGIVALFFLAITRGMPGDSKETIGMAGAVATMLEVAAITAAAVGLAFGASAERGAAPVGVGHGGWRAPAATLVAVALLATPGVATAADHDHGPHDYTAATASHDHPNQESGVTGALAAATLTGIFAAAPAAVHAGGTGNAIHDDSTAGTPCAPSNDQVAAADKLLADSTLALQKYHDVNVAVAAGYRPLGFEPNGINHYMNKAYLDDGRTIDPDRPESILYGRNKDGSLYPVGVMYMTGSVAERGPRLGGCLTPWHRHGFPFARPGEASVEMMHVWTVAVPGGPYAEHVEREYARIYLGVEPIDTEGGTAPAAGATTTTVAVDQLTSAFGFATGSNVSIAVALNVINVHRVALCAEPLRTAVAARVKNQPLLDRMCDPILNGPLPGASAPDLATILKSFTASKTAK